MKKRVVFMLIGIAIGCFIVVALYFLLGNNEVVEDPLNLEIDFSNYSEVVEDVGKKVIVYAPIECFVNETHYYVKCVEDNRW